MSERVGPIAISSWCILEGTMMYCHDRTMHYWPLMMLKGPTNLICMHSGWYHDHVCTRIELIAHCLHVCCPNWCIYMNTCTAYTVHSLAAAQQSLGTRTQELLVWSLPRVLPVSLQTSPSGLADLWSLRCEPAGEQQGLTEFQGLEQCSISYIILFSQLAHK